MTINLYSEISTIDISLREYQQESKNQIFEKWDNYNSVMLQMPTGTGKTRLFTSLISDINRYSIKIKESVKILVIAHRVELIEQIDKSLSKYSIAHGIIAGGYDRKLNFPVQVASIQSLTSKYNINDAKKLNVQFVIIDEAHHSLAETYKKLWELYPNAKFLGVTATPWRMSGNGFTSLFDTIILTKPIKWFIENNYLSNYQYYSVTLKGNINKTINNLTDFGTDGDYKISSLENVMNTCEIRAQLLDSYLTLVPGKKGIIYAISQNHAKQICKEYSSKGIKIKAIDSKTPKEERLSIVNEFRIGKIDIIVNVDIFSEGFDCPDIEFVQLARPTRSLAKYLQQVGRALRITEDKTHAVILDNVGMYSRFGLPDALRHWKSHFIGKNNSLDIVVNTIKSNSNNWGRTINLNEGNESMVLIQQTKDILDEESDIVENNIMEFKKFGPLRVEGSEHIEWNDPTYEFKNGIHYFKDFYKRTYCMYPDRYSIWHFERYTEDVFNRDILITPQIGNFTGECNFLKAIGKRLQYVGLFDYLDDELFHFQNPTNEGDKNEYYNYEGKRWDNYEDYENERDITIDDVGWFGKWGKATSDLIALIDYEVKEYEDINGKTEWLILGILNNGKRVRYYLWDNQCDFSSIMEKCKKNDYNYKIISVYTVCDSFLPIELENTYRLALGVNKKLYYFDKYGNFYKIKT